MFSGFFNLRGINCCDCYDLHIPLPELLIIVFLPIHMLMYSYAIFSLSFSTA